MKYIHFTFDFGMPDSRQDHYIKYDDDFPYEEIDKLAVAAFEKLKDFYKTLAYDYYNSCDWLEQFEENSYYNWDTINEQEYNEAVKYYEIC